MLGHPQRPGFTTVTPYLTVRHVDPVVEFLTRAFDATETYRTTGSAGGTHVEVDIGNAKIMLGGDTPSGTDPVPAALFLYVGDTDAVYERALDAGAESMLEPGENFEETRGAGVIDPFGNRWFIATHAPKPEDLVGHDGYLDDELQVDADELTPIALTTIARSDLQDVLAGGRSQADYYLDTETGEVLCFGDYESMVSLEDDPDELDEHERAIWEQKVAVQNDTDDRFLWVAPLDTHDAWQDMAAFTRLVRDRELRHALGDAIEGRGAFGRFRRELDRHPALRTAWFEFEKARAEKRLRDWMAMKGYRIVERGEE